MSSETLHIPREKLSLEARLLHYAIVSLQEELDAVDWYRQRADDSDDEALKGVLLHNMREEMEHAAMLMEWLRRNNADFARTFETYLFTEAPITAIETAAEPGGDNGQHRDAQRRDDLGFTIGPLRGK
ncbi:MAG TPA: ferritin [Stellaceae bacterium]|nr:ferritin [Stellaceae bacterium]